MTNPPFSLFREFVSLIYYYNKKFLVIGHISALNYKSVFTPLKEGKLSLGYTLRKKQQLDFYNNDGNMAVAVQWYTNLDKHYEPPFVKLTDVYSKEKHKKFFNYDAINVNSMRDIPKDYDGAMGVPITFLLRLNIKQFKIIGITKEFDRESRSLFLKDKKLFFMRYDNNKFTGQYDVSSLSHPVVEEDNITADSYYKIRGSDKKYKFTFVRVFIKRLI